VEGDGDCIWAKGKVAAIAFERRGRRRLQGKGKAVIEVTVGWPVAASGALVVAPRGALPVQELVVSALWWLGASSVVFDARVR
jgi:hypothetical protein